MPAQAAITIDVYQSGTSVVTSGTGTFDTTGLGPVYLGPAGSILYASEGLLRVGAAGSLTYRTGLVGPRLGSGATFGPSSSSGDLFGVGSFASLIYLPADYQSGAVVRGTATYLNATIASLGLTAGSYVFQSPVDTITVNVAGAVPEPTGWVLMISGVGAVGAALRRRRSALRLELA